MVVTEASEQFGCVVVGDTAFTVNGNQVVYGAQKVHYSPSANIGFALWGNACLLGQRVDVIVSEFADSLPSTATPRSAGRDLAALLAEQGQRDGRPWNQLRGGAHVCGYQDGVPVIFHAHTGDEAPADQRPFELYEDIPDATAGAHIRNGYYPMFIALYNGMQLYAAALSQMNFRWPLESVDDRVSYYTIIIETMARTLEAAQRVQGVGRAVSAIAFNRNGLQVDRVVPRDTELVCTKRESMSFDLPIDFTRAMP